jgi:hypothetical protein
MDAVTFGEARDAVAEVLPLFTALLRRTAVSPRSAVGEWSVPDVACHLSHAIEVDAASISGRQVPEVEPTPAGTAAWNASMLRADGQRDLEALADRIDASGGGFLDLSPSTDTVDWLGGSRLAPTTVACHLLAELLLHGHDVARAGREQWPIQREHAAVAIVGGGLPIINACPDLFLRHPVDPKIRARVELRLVGHQRFALVLDEGLRIELPPTGSVDAYLATHADQALLIFFGRRSPWRVAATGKALAWGRRPRALLSLLGAMTSP